jgi:hypothetical protein
MARLVINKIDESHIEISGIIDEEAKFGPLFKDLPAEAWLDLKGVTRINSSGVRHFLRGIAQYTGKAHFQKCSPAIVDQITMIPEFLGTNGVIESIVAPYFCESCDDSRPVRLEIGKDLTTGIELSEAPERSCPKCDNALIFEETPEIFFHFLLRNVDESA